MDVVESGESRGFVDHWTDDHFVVGGFDVSEHALWFGSDSEIRVA